MSLFSSLVLAGCGDKLVAPAPRLSPPPAMPSLPASQLRGRLEVPLETLAGDLDRLTETQILTLKHKKIACGIGHCRLDLHAVRTAPVRVSGAEDALNLTLPFDADARLRLPGMFSGVKTKLHSGGVMDIRSRITLDRKGQLHSVSDGVVRLESGQLRLGPVRGDLADLWNGNAEKLSRQVFKALDRQITRRIDSKRALEKLWRAGFQPIRLHTTPGMWLAMAPQALQVGAVQVENGRISLPLGLKLNARLLVQPDAPAAKPTDLPQLEPLTRADNQYDLHLPVVLPYAQAETLALQALQAHPPKVAGMKLRFLSLQFLPSADAVYVRTHFCARSRWDVLNLFGICGTVYFRGVPGLDAAHQQIRVRKLSYDLQSENILLRRLNQLAGPEIADILGQKLRFDLRDDMQRLRHKLDAAFAAGTGRNLHLSGSLTELTPQSLSWSQQGFVAVFTARGQLNLQLQH